MFYSCEKSIWRKKIRYFPLRNFPLRKQNKKNYNFLDCDWFNKLLFCTDSLAKLLSDSLLLHSLLLHSLLLHSLLSNSSTGQSHSKLQFRTPLSPITITYYPMYALLPVNGRLREVKNKRNFNLIVLKVVTVA